jgi:hypothetical protein
MAVAADYETPTNRRPAAAQKMRLQLEFYMDYALIAYSHLESTPLWPNVQLMLREERCARAFGRYRSGCIMILRNKDLHHLPPPFAHRHECL